MSQQIDNGGPAFPWGDYCGQFAPHSGMTLRDWFATHATEADIEAHLGGTIHPKTGNLYGCRTREAAKYAYADAMIRTRKGGTDGA